MSASVRLSCRVTAFAYPTQKRPADFAAWMPFRESSMAIASSADSASRSSALRYSAEEGFARLLSPSAHSMKSNASDRPRIVRAWLQLAHEFHLPLPAPELDGLTVEAVSHEPLQFGDEVSTADSSHPRGEVIEPEVLPVRSIGFSP
jgi:hypothetical protein